MTIHEFIINNKAIILSSAISALMTSVAILFVIGKDKYKWFWREVVKMYSDQPSYFSKKRIESGSAFIFGFWMTIFYLKNRIDDMDIWSFGYVLTAWLFIAGYTVNQIQSEKEKKNGNGKKQEEKTP